MPKAFVISWRREHREAQCGCDNAEVIERSKLAAQNERETLSSSDVQKDNHSNSGRRSFPLCFSTQRDVDKVKVSESLLDSEKVKKGPGASFTFELLRKPCAGRKSQCDSREGTVDDEKHHSNLNENTHHSHQSSHKQRYSSESPLFQRNSEECPNLNQSQTDSQDLLPDPFVLYAKTRDPRRAILFCESEEEIVESADLNNNNKHCFDNQDKEIDCVTTIRNYKHEHQIQPAIKHASQLGHLRPIVEDCSSTRPSYYGQDIFSTMPSDSSSDHPSHKRGICSSLISPDAKKYMEGIHLTHVNGFHTTPYLAELDNRTPRHQSHRLGNHRVLARGSPPLVSAFRSTVKPVQSGPSSTSLRSSSSSSLCPTMTVSPLRRPSLSLQPETDKCGNPSRYQSDGPVLTPNSTLPDPTGSNSAMVMVEKEEGTNENKFGLNYNDGNIESARDNTVVLTGGMHWVGVSDNMTTINRSRTQEVTAVSTRHAIDDRSRELQEVIKDPSRSDQSGSETARCWDAGSCHDGTSGATTGDRDRHLPWEEHHRSPEIRADCHLVTVTNIAAGNGASHVKGLKQSDSQACGVHKPNDLRACGSERCDPRKNQMIGVLAQQGLPTERNEYVKISESSASSTSPHFTPRVVHPRIHYEQVSPPWRPVLNPSSTLTHTAQHQHIAQIATSTVSASTSEVNPPTEIKDVSVSDPRTSESSNFLPSNPTIFSAGRDMVRRSPCTEVSESYSVAVSSVESPRPTEMASQSRKRHRGTRKKRSFMIASLIGTDSDSCSDHDDAHLDDLPTKKWMVCDRTITGPTTGSSELTPKEKTITPTDEQFLQDNSKCEISDLSSGKAPHQRPNFLPLDRAATDHLRSNAPGTNLENNPTMNCKREAKAMTVYHEAARLTSNGQKHLNGESESAVHSHSVIQKSSSVQSNLPKASVQPSTHLDPNSPQQTSAEYHALTSIQIPHHPFPFPLWPLFPSDRLKHQGIDRILTSVSDIHSSQHPSELGNSRLGKSKPEPGVSSKAESCRSLFQPMPLRLFPGSSAPYHPYLSPGLHSLHAASLQHHNSDPNSEYAGRRGNVLNHFQTFIENTATMNPHSHLSESVGSLPNHPALLLPIPGQPSNLHCVNSQARHDAPSRLIHTTTGPTFSPCGSDGISVASSSEPGLSPTPSTSLSSPSSPRPHHLLSLSPRSFMVPPSDSSGPTSSTMTTPMVPKTVASMMMNNHNNIQASSSRLGLRYDHLQLKMGRGGGTGLADSSKSFKAFLENANVKLEFINGGNGIKNPLLSTEFADNKIGLVTGGCSMPCPVCTLTFDTAKLLQRHLKTHREIKRFLCTFCAKGFNDTFDLKRHTRTHTGVRPYKCDMCEKAFTQRCSLESHRRKIHGCVEELAFNERRVKLYVCEDCGHSTDLAEEHYAHMRHSHSARPGMAVGIDTECRGGGRG